VTQPVAVRDAATVMLVRDGAAGLEVFMLQRTLNAVFVGGHYVFPGGAVDDADRDPSVAEYCDGLTDATASELLNVPSGGLAYWVAAVRECFEEAGVLVAATSAGATIDFDDPDTARRFEAYRRAIHRGDIRLIELCEREGLHLALGGIYYLSHWITPVGEPRRFSTRFFVAQAPPGQEPLHDDSETIASQWIRPAAALALARTGGFQLISPTIKHLEYLAAFDTTEGVLCDASAVRSPPTVMPRMRQSGEELEVDMPGEPGYEEIGPDRVG
jgi:8-oxo-dGTP pyrophosphatase MutT (NUDIX family)